MTRPKIFFYVQHLLGIGHLVRAGRIASALAKASDVLLVVGGALPPGLLPEDLRSLHLPPVKAGAGGFAALVHPDGRPFAAADQADRRDRLIEAFDADRPDVLLIEAFPFGRRQMRFELLPLLERAAAARPRPLVASSVRDILQAARPERQRETVDLLRRHFDLVLVHGDPGLVGLDGSFPTGEIADLIRHTGVVGPEPPLPASGRETFDVVVSAGGGAVGGDLLRAAIAARRLTSLREATWLILTGPNLPVDLRGSAAPGLAVRAFEPHLPTLLGQARVSVSQAGYNTVADLAAARCRAVLVPFARGGETEQSVRAALLHERGWAVALAEADLTPERLAEAIERALALPEAGPRLDLGGAAATRRVLAEALARRAAQG